MKEIKPGKSERKAKPTKDKIITYVIYGVLALGAIIYVLVMAMPPKDPAKDTSQTPQTPQTSQSNPEMSSTQTFEPILPDNNNESSDSDPAYEIKDDHVTLSAGVNTEGKRIGMCYVYIPIGYDASAEATSVTLKPKDLDLTVTGNSPIRLKWGNVKAFEELKAKMMYEDETTGRHHVIAKYDYVASESNTVTVYVIRRRPPANSNKKITYTIALDLKYNGLYPNITIYENDLAQYLNARYPDILELTKAMFRPENPDKIIAIEDMPGMSDDTSTSDANTSDASNTSESEPNISSENAPNNGYDF